MSHKIYLAASWKERDRAREICELLEKENIIQTEDWWNHTGKSASEYAYLDKEAIQQAEIYVMLNATPVSGGKYTEFGMAIQRNIPIFVFGTRMKIVFKDFVTEHIDETEPEKIRDWIVKYFEERKNG